MEYTIQKLAKLAGVSTRTLRYYDQVGLLKPTRINSSGYRIYGQQAVDQLQQILFYRELELSLEQIKEIVTAPNFNSSQALREHREQLLRKQAQLTELLSNLDKTIASQDRGITMRDEEKFAGFKQKLIEENEAKYGKEIRAKYGDEQVNRSNQKVKNLTPEQYAEIEKLSQDVLTSLAEAFATGDPAGALAQKAVDLHRQWLCYFWDGYTKEAHAGVAQMYVNDPRFTAYYDKVQPGLAVFLRDAVLIYTGINKAEH